MTKCNASNKVYSDILDAIHNLRTVKHAKPTAEKIFNYLKKSNEQLDLTMFKFNLEKLVKEKYLEIKGECNNESYIVKKLIYAEEERVEISDSIAEDEVEDAIRITENSISGLEEYIDNMASQLAEVQNKDKQKSQTDESTTNIEKKEDSIIVLMMEKIIRNLESEVAFLRKQINEKDKLYENHIDFLQSQINILTPKPLERDDVNFSTSRKKVYNLSFSKTATNNYVPPREAFTKNTLNESHLERVISNKQKDDNIENHNKQGDKKIDNNKRSKSNDGNSQNDVNDKSNKSKTN